jgi:hypothetical protein
MKRYEVLQVPGGSALFQRVFTRLGCNGRPPRFRVEFYPYSSLVLTIRRREEAMYVRFSDLLQRAPLPVLEGGAALLLSRVYRRKAPRDVVEPYLEYARSHKTRHRISRMRSGRVRVRQGDPQGRHFDLSKLFDELNIKYFDGALQRPRIGWSVRSWRRQFGCYDPGPNQILLNRRMDRPGVPPCAAVGLQSGVALKRISRRGKTICGIRTCASSAGPLSPLICLCLSFRLHSKVCRFSSGSFLRLLRADRDRDSGGRISRLRVYRLFFPELRQDSDREWRSRAWQRRRPGNDR